MLFNSTDAAVWEAALALYPETFKALAATKTDKSIIALDQWYQTELPSILATRSPQYLNREEINQLVAWKLKRGKYRPALAKMVAEHADAVVRRTSEEAFKLATTDLKAAITKMSELKGVGPATASGAPDKVPFMADESVDSVPGLGKIAYNLSYYLKFATKVVEKADQLKAKGCSVNTPHFVELALWADMMADKYNVARPTATVAATVSEKKYTGSSSNNKRKAADVSSPSKFEAKDKASKHDDKDKGNETTHKKPRSTRSAKK
ncbi:hypothetical protein BGX23_003952 [Mortierella sp. AD031]|nr:hypothetical protein BGX23_003952 [Mortierella sp. AD031]